MSDNEHRGQYIMIVMSGTAVKSDRWVAIHYSKQKITNCL